MDLGVQFPCIGIRGAGDKALIGGGYVEGVEVREDGLRDSQHQGQEPDEGHPQENAGSGA